MQIKVNGETRKVNPDATVASLVEQEGLSGKRIAVEYNGEILPRSEYAQTPLQAGDSLEIVHAIGGG